MKIQNDIVNSWLVSFFLFQFGILLPLALIFNVEIAYVISTTILLSISLLINKFHFNPLFILSTILLICYMSLSFLYHQIGVEIIITILIGFISKGISGLYISSNKMSFSHLYKSLLLLGWINLLVLTLATLLFNLDGNVGYMRLGYAIVPSAIVLLGELLIFKFRMINFLGFIFSIIMLLLYGNRGVFLVIMLFGILLFIYIYNKNIKTLIGIIVSITVLYVSLSFNLLTKTILFLYNELDIYSYSLMKFSRAIEEGFISASSGRDQLYIQGLNQFLESPIIGNGIGYTFMYSTTSAHNIILQILIESGIFGLLTWSVLTVYIIYKLNGNKNIFIRYSLIFLLSLSIGRLTVSSDMWLRPELWMLLGIILSIFNFRRNGINKRKELLNKS